MARGNTAPLFGPPCRRAHPSTRIGAANLTFFNLPRPATAATATVTTTTATA